jgi:hypothetical protein
MKLKYKNLFWLLALLAAIGFDLLFWEKQAGINFFIFILLALLSGLIPIWLEKIRIPWTSYLLLLPLLFFSGMTFIRSEPFTTVINVLLALCALMLFTITARNGDWLKFTLRDHLVGIWKFFINCFAGGILFFIKTKKDPEASSQTTTNTSQEPELKQPSWLKQAAPYLRGILISLPILVILGFLLASADPIFKSRIQNWFSWFRIENLADTIFRAFYILIISYLLLSAYYFGLFESKKLAKEGEEKPGIKPFLGAIEAHIILAAVNLLFVSFVLLQFRYLFGGSANINLEGFTFAEYARRGFFELLAVALISLGLFYLLSEVTKRENKSRRRSFSALGLILVGLVGIILVSAFTRLSLYEDAYGFTRLRTLTHVFIIFTGLLLISVAVLEVTRKMRRLALILVLFLIGFGVTINLMNIDRFIVNRNINRLLTPLNGQDTESLDTDYLLSLSNDAVPPLVDYFNDPDVPQSLRNEIGGILACRLSQIDQNRQQPWTSYHYARSRAFDMLLSQEAALEEYLSGGPGSHSIIVNGVERPCYID